MMTIHLFAFLLGLLIVLGTHVTMLIWPVFMKMHVSMQMHSYLNIFACLLLVYYVAFTEKWIRF